MTVFYLQYMFITTLPVFTFLFLLWTSLGVWGLCSLCATTYVSDNELMMNWFCRMVDRRKALTSYFNPGPLSKILTTANLRHATIRIWTCAFTSYFHPGPLSEILTIANLRHVAIRVWTCAESEFILCWMRLCSSDNNFTTAPYSAFFKIFNFVLYLYNLMT